VHKTALRAILRRCEVTSEYEKSRPYRVNEGNANPHELGSQLSMKIMSV